jgi:hypothetical protein
MSFVKLVQRYGMDGMYTCNVQDCCKIGRCTMWLRDTFALKHLQQHHEQLQNIATILLVDKQSPFSMLDEYTMKQILTHCPSQIDITSSLLD